MRDDRGVTRVLTAGTRVRFQIENLRLKIEDTAGMNRELKRR